MQFNSEEEMKAAVARGVHMANTGKAADPNRDALEEVIGKGIAASLAICRGKPVDEEGLECREAVLGVASSKDSSEDYDILDHVAAVAKGVMGCKK